MWPPSKSNASLINPVLSLLFTSFFLYNPRKVKAEEVLVENFNSSFFFFWGQIKVIFLGLGFSSYLLIKKNREILVGIKFGNDKLTID